MIEKIFNSKEMQELVELHNSKKISIEDIMLIYKNRLDDVYNNLLHKLYSRCSIDSLTDIDSNMIFYKEKIESTISETTDNIYILSALKQEGYIYPCGIGYTLERPIQGLTAAEYDRQQYLFFEYGLI